MHFELCSSCKQTEDGGLIDQFLMYGDEYKTVRDAVAKALMDGDVDQIEEVLEVCFYFLNVHSSSFKCLLRFPFSEKPRLWIRF